MGKTEGEDCVQAGGLETQADEPGHAEEVVSDDEGAVGTEKKVKGGGTIATGPDDVLSDLDF